MLEIVQDTNKELKKSQAVNYHRMITALKNKTKDNNIENVNINKD